MAVEGDHKNREGCRRPQGVLEISSSAAFISSPRCMGAPNFHQERYGTSRDQQLHWPSSWMLGYLIDRLRCFAEIRICSWAMHVSMNRSWEGQSSQDLVARVSSLRAIHTQTLCTSSLGVCLAAYHNPGAHYVPASLGTFQSLGPVRIA